MDKKTRQWIIEAVLIAAAVGISLITPPAGLEKPAMIFIGLLVWAIGNWVLNLFPSHVTGLLLLCSLVIFKLLSFSQAFSVFSGTTFWLILAILAIGAAVSKTGLLNRICYKLLSLFPPTYSGQIIAMLVGGTIVGPFMPSTSAKVAIAGGFGTRIAELLGFKDRSKGMAGMFCAMYTGFCLSAPLWITATFWSYLVTGLLTEEEAAPFGFGGWFLAMLPWAIIVLVASYFLIRFMYKDTPVNTLDKDTIRKMSADLGPMKKDEKITAVILVCCVILWCLERKIGISSAITAVLGMCALMITGVFTTKDLKNLNWPLMIFVGSVLVLSTGTSTLGINTWIADTFGNSVGSLISNPVIMVIVVGVLIQLMHFIIVAGASCITIILTILIPFLHAAGINPWFAGIVALAMAQPWYLRYMNGNTVAAFGAAGGDEKVDWNMTVPYCLAYHVVCLLALIISIPWWKLIGKM